MESMKGSIPGVIMRVETDDGKTLELVLSHVGLSRNSDFGKTHVAMRNTMREKRDEIAVTGDLVLGLCSADSARFAQAIINDDPYLAWATYTDVLQDDTTSVGEGGTRSANFVSGFATAKFILDAFRLGDMLASEKVSAAAMAALVIHCDPVLHPPSPASEYPRWVKWCPCTKFYEASVLSKKFVAPNTRIGHLHAENTPVCLAVMLARACDLSPDGETRSGPACDFGLDFVYDYLAAMVGSTEAELSSWVFYEDLKNATGPFEGIPASAVKNFFDLMTAASASRAKAATGSNFDHNTLACKDKHCRKRAKEHRREFIKMGGTTNRKRKYPSDTEEIARLAASDSSDSGKSSESSDGSSSDN